MKTCPNHPDIAFTTDTCPVCAAEQSATMSEATIRILFDALDTIHNVLTEAGISRTDDGEKTPEATTTTTIEKPDTMEEAFKALNRLGKRDLNNAHREITGTAVKRGDMPGPIIARIVGVWFPEPDAKTEDEPKTDTAPEPTADPEPDKMPARERFAELRAIKDWPELRLV